MVVLTEPTARSAGGAVARLARVVEHALVEADLSLPQYRLLLLLAEGSVAASALADHLAVTRPSVTTLVDGLVQRGLVERHPDGDDRRRVGHALTTDGRAALHRAEDAVERRLSAIAGHLGEPAATEAVASLGTWHHALDAHRRERMTRG